MNEQIDVWLKEGLRLYSEGEVTAALEAWDRILSVDADHALAQQYVVYVRQVYAVDAPGAPAPGGAADPGAAGTGSDARRLVGYHAASSWSDLVDSSFDVTVPAVAVDARPSLKASSAIPGARQAFESRAQQAPAVVEDEYTQLMRRCQELIDLGDLAASLDVIERVLKIRPHDESALAVLQRNELALINVYESRLGDMKRTPTQVMPAEEIMWTKLHHRAGFLLSQVDGMLSYEDLLEVSGMSRFDTMRILHELVEQGIIG